MSEPGRSTASTPRRKKNVLWVTNWAPYDAVPHAGGQTANYYIKSLSESDELDLRVLTFCNLEELPLLDFEKYGIPAWCIARDSIELRGVFARVLNLESRHNPFNRYLNMVPNAEVLSLRDRIRRICTEGFVPEVVVLQWTEMALLAPWIKRSIPSCKVVCVEEDVTFVRIEREVSAATSAVRRALRRRRARRARDTEISALRAADAVTVNNFEDLSRLVERGIDEERILRIVPYFEDLSDVTRRPDTTSLLFFGAMNRPENHDAVVWFADHVLERAVQEAPVRLTVLGNRPDPALAARQDPAIEVLGYQVDVRPFFANALCLVAPLRFGAGIKVKILEAMSAGLPVLTTRVGIEGIPAENGRNFYLCESPEDYLQSISALIRDPEAGARMGHLARERVHESFDLGGTVARLRDLLVAL